MKATSGDGMQGSSIWRATKRWLPAVVALGLLLVVSILLSSRNQSPNRDFISYWSAARLLVQHGNPYGHAAVLRLEQSAGYDHDQALVMRNTPFTLFLFAPLGWFGYSTAATVWEMALILAALGSVRLLEPLGVGTIPYSVFFFAPTIDCILAGQSTIFVLLGICLFLRLEERRPFLGGLSLVLCLLKPHLLALFWPVLLLEILRHRRFAIVAGAAVGLAVATAIAMMLDPHVWSHYVADVRSEGIQTQFFPNMAYTLRWLIAPQHLWPQLLPLAVGLPAALWYWWRRRKGWRWSREGLLLIAGSVLVSPYSFHVDEVLYLPAVLYGFTRTEKRAQWFFVGINALAIVLMIHFSSLSTRAILWTGPATFLWLLYTWKHRQAQPTARLTGDAQPVTAP